MARPHPALVELAALRSPPRTVADPGALLVSAVDHRMQGLLWSAVVRDEVELPAEVERELAALDLRTRARHTELRSALEEVSDRLTRAGVEVAVFKGIAAEDRWYQRTGERPSRDLDLWLAPHQVDRVEEVVAMLDPRHPLLGSLDSLVSRGHLQSVDVRHGAVWIDLHVDPFKLGVKTPGLDRVWGRLVESEGGFPQLDPVTSLLQFLIHLNKDRFSWLLGFADIARIVAADGDTTLEAIEVAEELGLRVPVAKSMEVVDRYLGSPPRWAAPRGWRSRLWDVLWRDRLVLRGEEGFLRAHRRQVLLPFLTDEGFAAGVGNIVRMAFPPRELANLYFYDVPGRYPSRLLRGRVRRWRERRRAIRQTVVGFRSAAGPPKPSSGLRPPVLRDAEGFPLGHRGAFIAIGGPDGVGKTTLASAIVERVGDRGRYFHFIPSPIHRLMTSVPLEPVLIEKNRERGNRFLGILRIGKALVRAWLSYLLAIRPAVRSGHVVVGDRWLYGYLAQPLPLKFFGPTWLARLVLRIAPAPDRLVILDASPETIRRRKPELSRSEIESERALWREVSPGSLLLEATVPTDQLVEHALSETVGMPGPRLRRYPPLLGHVLLPESPRAAALAGTTLYAPTRRRGIMGQHAGRAMIRALGTWWLPVAGQGMLPLEPEHWEALAGALSDHRIRPERIALYTRTQRDRPGYSVLVIEDGQPRAFARLGPPTSVNSEWRALELLEHARPSTFRFPSPIDRTSVGSMDLILESAVLNGFHHPPKRPPLEEIVAEIQLALEGFDRPADVPESWRSIHGDFTPWNLRESRDGLALIDWESVDWGPPNADQVFYLMTSAAVGLARGAGPFDEEATQFWLSRLTDDGSYRDLRLVRQMSEMLI